MQLSLEGRRALVGGGSAGIGLATAHELAALGAEVTLLARTAAKLESAVASLPAATGQQHHFLICDYTRPEATATTVREYLERHEAQILINNAGGPASGPIATATTDAFMEAYRVHLMCNHLLTQAIVPKMQASGYGRVVNIISTSVREPLDNLGVSNTTRGAVAAWAKTMANELGPLGITVNNVLPGYTLTDRLEEIIEKRMAVTGKTRDEIVELFRAHVPLRRFAQPAEVAAVVAFLASPAAAYVNGVSIAVDGGRMRSI